jgi:SAM-dependent methyltransferase
MEKKILDIGCGENKVKDSIGMDIVALDCVDVVHDALKMPYPFKNESCYKIHLRHVIEHFTIEEIKKVLSECYRILSNEGKIIISVPHAFSLAAYTDITHKTFFTFNSGKFFDINYSKSYYNINSGFKYDLIKIDCSVCWFDWKSRLLRKVDNILSELVKIKLLNALKNKYKPSLADRIVRKNSYQFVEIKWTFNKIF